MKHLMQILKGLKLRCPVEVLRAENCANPNKGGLKQTTPLTGTLGSKSSLVHFLQRALVRILHVG